MSKDEILHLTVISESEERGPDFAIVFGKKEKSIYFQ